MGYMHIENLYKCQDILLFKRCYALEKIHGTSAHVAWRDGQLHFHPGGGSATVFEALFTVTPAWVEKLAALGANVTVYGEFYGGSHQKMAHVYGAKQRFVVFDVQIGDVFLNVPNMAQVAEGLGLDVVPWIETETLVSELDAIRDAPSVQAVKNGMPAGLPREGVVLRPLIEVTKNNGDRIMAKHKRDDFAERTTPPKVIDPAQLKILSDARAIASEWVTQMRLAHVLDKLPTAGIEQTGQVIKAMIEDVKREAGAEIVWSKEAQTAISRRAGQLFKEYLNSKIG